jgi:hypothetical protein
MHIKSDPCQTTDAVFACDAAALDAETRREHFTWLREELPRLVAEIQELPGGYSLRLPGNSFPAVSTFVDRERKCCPFLRFTIELESGGAVVWLRLTGPAGVRAFLDAEIGLDRIAAGLASKTLRAGPQVIERSED